MIIYGGVQTFNVKASDALSDNVLGDLEGFIRCTDVRDAVPLKNDGTDDDYKKVILYQCEMTHAPNLFFNVITGLVALITFIVAVTTNCCTGTERKFNSYAFPTMLALSFALCVVSILLMAITTTGISMRFIPCNDFDAATIQRLQSDGDVCVTGNGSNNDTALKWLSSLIVFYTGNALQMLVVIIFLLVNGCCTTTSTRRNSLTDPLQPAYTNYGAYA